MHIQIVTLNLKDMTHEQWVQAGMETFAPAFAQVDGLLTKVWISDPAANTYGGVYTWRDKAAMEQFLQSELFETVANHPNLENIASQDFEVLEGPTRVTRGLVEATV